MPIVEVKGGPLQRGLEQGKGAKTLIQTALDRYRKILPDACHCSWEEVIQKAHTFLLPGQEAFADLIQELKGIAEGAEVPFEDIWALNCYQELVEMAQKSRGCTSLVVGTNHTTNRHIFLAHNEDWLSVDRDTVYLVRSKPQDGPTFLGMIYGPLLVNIGFNEVGIGETINSVFSTDTHSGVPRVLYSRAILNAQSMEEALQACLQPKRAGGYHFLLSDRQGSVCSIETNATQHHIVQGEKSWLVHTNHYVSAKLKSLETKRDLSNSHLRLHRARQLLESQFGSLNLEAIQSILRDHANHPDSICEHEDPTCPPTRRFQTLVSIIMDLTEGVMWAAPGPPCENIYTEHPL
jgi:isopenicillin-N N-acyltransferase-like protein